MINTYDFPQLRAREVDKATVFHSRRQRSKTRVDLGRVRELFTRLVAIQESPFELAIINTASQFAGNGLP